MFRSLASRLGLIHVVYLLLLVVAVGSTTLVLWRQQDDGLVVNLSGRQRMLTQRITHQLLGYSASRNRGESGQAERQAALLSMQVFERTHDALANGGPAPTDLQMVTMREVPPATPVVAHQMQRVGALWTKYSAQARNILDGSPEEQRKAEQYVLFQNTELLSEMNTAVSLMQREGEQRVLWLYGLQGGTLLVGLLVTLVLSSVLRRSVIEPLKELNQASDSMSRGEVHRRVQVATGPTEILELGSSFERLRVAMKNLLGASPGLGEL